MTSSQRDAAPTVAALGEHKLLDRLRARVPAPPDWVAIGIGDDAAVLEPARGEVDVITTDSQIEGVHFRRAWTTLDAVGHKALAVNLSDLAAMGASPRAALLSLALPDDLLVDDFDALLAGFLKLAAETKTPLVGGNLSRSPGPLVVDVTLVGSARRRRVMTRRAARRNDDLYVTGTIGAAATGLAMRERGAAAVARTPVLDECVQRYDRPTPRLRYGLAVSRNRAALACVDLSDGLADAITQMAHASGTGAVVDSTALPIHDGARQWASETSADPIAFAMSGGEDYELLFAVPARRRSRFLAVARSIKDTPVTRIGRMTAEPGLWLDRDGRRDPIGRGFTHF